MQTESQELAERSAPGKGLALYVLHSVGTLTIRLCSSESGV